MKKNILNESPLVYTIDNYITNEECNHFIKLSFNKLKKAGVAGATRVVHTAGRNNSNCWIRHNYDDITLRVVKKIADLVEYPYNHAESFQIIHYSKNQKYDYHQDGFPVDDSIKSKTYLGRGGQRMVTALVYLNDVTKGGGTGFKKLNIEVKPKKGRIVVFENCYEGTNVVHPDSLHSGRPVIEGEKYAFNLWFREIPATELYFQ